MLHSERFLLALKEHNYLNWAREIDEIVNLKLKSSSNGNQLKWDQALKRLPPISKQYPKLDTAIISI